MKDLQKIRCMDIINEVKQNLSLNDITVIFDDISFNEILNREINSFIYFNTMDSDNEKRTYNSISDEDKLQYRTNSCAIHYPNISALELSLLYKSMEYTGLYDITTLFIIGLIRREACSKESIIGGVLAIAGVLGFQLCG